uniref:Uncharacterized protein n=1 Tax=Anguilla anguilla TaxID=7936 RepID=A0A0E9TWE8_ANGAN
MAKIHQHGEIGLKKKSPPLAHEMTM